MAPRAYIDPKRSCIPGTDVPYVRRYGLTDFLIDFPAIPASLSTLGYERALRHAPDGLIWVSALPANILQLQLERRKPGASTHPVFPVIVESDAHHTRTYRSASVAACYEAEIARINEQYARDCKRTAKATKSAPIVATATPIRIAPTPVVAEPTTLPATGSPEWKRLIRALYRHHSGSPAKSITRDVLVYLRERHAIPA